MRAKCGDYFCAAPADDQNPRFKARAPGRVSFVMQFWLAVQLLRLTTDDMPMLQSCLLWLDRPCWLRKPRTCQQVEFDYTVTTVVT
eukprot:4337636-Amphidinium_carterae.1